MKAQVGAMALLVGVALPASAQFIGQRDVERLASAPADHRIPYGDDPLQFGDLRLPPGKGPHPVAIVIHGGCWLAAFADLKLTSPLADALRGDGIATWNVEFRRVDNPGGGWPGTLLDVGRAVDHVRVLARSHPLDTSRVIVIGNSAGGHLALWAAGRRRVPKESPLAAADPLPVRGAMSLGGMGDLRSYSAEPCGASIPRLVGATGEAMADRFRQASPIELLPLGVKQVLVTGKQDTIVPPRHSTDYVAAAKAKGDDVELILIEDAAHFEVIAPGSSSWPVVRNAALSLLGMASAGKAGR